ncbi:HlyD family secretion protein [Solibacillus sp. FSL H8-0523]|uniref:HlyD family secretion protein n=1 Tax=Solibacillus sp. FSL H8-0523 TaxID=2954511 RepID=UPI003101AACD
MLSKKAKIIAVIMGLIVVVNAYLLLKDNDVILKKYYINDAHFAVAKDHEKMLPLDAIVTSSNEHFIAAPVQAVNEVLVTEGQTVNVLSELVVFKQQQTEKEVARLQTERAAYTTELAELEKVFLQLDSMSSETQPNSSMASDSINDGETLNVNLSVELGIEQGTPTAEGIAIIQRAIAETTRQIELLDSQITQLSEYNLLTSPVEGVVKEIVLEGDSIIFNIQSSNKKIIAYVTPKQWQEIELEQFTEITLFEGQDNEFTLDGVVSEKQQIPARNSIAFEEMKRHEKINSSETIYEISILPNEDLFDLPVGTLASANITVNQVFDSFGIHEDWLVQKATDEDEETQYVYMLDENGKTTLASVEELFTYQTKLNQREALLIEGEEEEEVVQETSPRIQTVKLTDENVVKEDKDELTNVAVISGPNELSPIFLNEKERNLNAPTFRPYPLQLFDRSQIDSQWQLILEYWLK